MPPRRSDKTWTDDDVLDAVVQIIEEIKDVYPIDMSRSYRIGSSTVRSGTDSLAVQYSSVIGQHFTVTIRPSVQGSIERDRLIIASQSAVWLYVWL